MSKFGAVFALSALAVSSVVIAGEWKNHPHLHKAHEQIENAKKSLREANDKKNSEFGGHRAKAEELLSQAQHEIEEAVQWADNPANR